MLAVTELSVSPAVMAARPTNSPTNLALSATHTGLPLIDTVRVRGRITSHCIRVERFKRAVLNTGEFSEYFTSARQDMLSGTRIEVSTRGSLLYAAMERSLPNLLRGNNVIAVTVEQAHQAITDLYEEAAAFVDWDCKPWDLEVSRLDLPRDFDGIDCLDQLLGGLSRLRVPRTSLSAVYNAPDYGHALTLRRGVLGSWVASLYDKPAQLLHLADRARTDTHARTLRSLAVANEHRLRFEPQIHRQSLRRAGVRTVADMTEPTLVNLREHYFKRARFDQPVGGAPHIEAMTRRLAASGGPAYKHLGDVISMLMAEAWGLPQPATSPKSIKKYKAYAEQWELSAADMTQVGGPAVALDFTAGTLRAAS